MQSGESSRCGGCGHRWPLFDSQHSLPRFSEQEPSLIELSVCCLGCMKKTTHRVMLHNNTQCAEQWLNTKCDVHIRCERPKDHIIGEMKYFGVIPDSNKLVANCVHTDLDFLIASVRRACKRSNSVPNDPLVESTLQLLDSLMNNWKHVIDGHVPAADVLVLCNGTNDSLAEVANYLRQIRQRGGGDAIARDEMMNFFSFITPCFNSVRHAQEIFDIYKRIDKFNNLLNL